MNTTRYVTQWDRATERWQAVPWTKPSDFPGEAVRLDRFQAEALAFRLNGLRDKPEALPTTSNRGPQAA